MVRNFVSATLSAALCTMSVAPAMAQEYRSGLDAPRGATATVNLRVPLGVPRAQREQSRPSYGLTLGYGRSMPSAAYDGREITRQLRVADLRFDRAGMRRAEVVSFDLANLDRDRRLNIGASTGKKEVWWYILILMGAGLAICGLTECLEGSSSSSDGPSI